MPTDRWQRGWHVPTQQDVVVRLGVAEPPEARAAALEALRSHAELRRRALFPSVTALVEAALEPATREPPYIALAWEGPVLSSRLERGASSAGQVAAWCTEACLLLAALAAVGLELPDAAPQRFSVSDLSGGRAAPSTRLWLSDLWGVREADSSVAQASHGVLARELCAQLFGGLDQDVLSGENAAALRAASSIGELVEILRRL